MFCNQCEQTARGTGCTVAGVCGKKAEVAALQDLLVHALKGLSLYAREGRKKGIIEEEVNIFTVEGLFTTLTNVNFDPERFGEFINRCFKLTGRMKESVGRAGGRVDFSAAAAAFRPSESLEGMVNQGEEAGSPWDVEAPEDIRSLQQTLLFGMKGVAAYAHHAAILGQKDDQVFAFLQEGLSALAENNLDMEGWLNLVFRCGETNLRAMELLDAGNTETYGHPVPTEVSLGAKKGKCILVSGHDLKDLQGILEQTKGKGINVYTHGEMLPAHGYPKLKEHTHFYGHFGGAWQNQREEFARFPGAIIMTTNCIQKPKDSYLENIFTTAVVGWPGAKHLPEGDFSQAIDKALSMPGFPEDEDKGNVTAGFARNAVLGAADKIVEAVKNGDIRRFFLVGGCDGSRRERSYYTEFVEKVPGDAVVLTLGCGKYRFLTKEMGQIGGIPRLLDMGQCNDAYSAIKVAEALAEAFDCDVNDLPLSLVISWYEQKAAAVLLSLLYLGIRNIKLGPSLPAFISPNVLNLLVEKFNIGPITTPERDLAEMV